APSHGGINDEIRIIQLAPNVLARHFGHFRGYLAHRSRRHSPLSWATTSKPSGILGDNLDEEALPDLINKNPPHHLPSLSLSLSLSLSRIKSTNLSRPVR
ncbi:hypothetical protein ACLOJK_026850, partial [Asimina triloba]